MSFKMAGSLGFKEAMAKAGPVLLEPDLAARGHRPHRSTRATSWATSTPAGAGCRAPRPSATASRRSPPRCPTSEILRYAIDLRSITGGRGRFTVAPRPLRPAARPPGRQGGQGQRRVTRPRLARCEECGFDYADAGPADAPAAHPGLRPALPGAADPLPARRGRRRPRPPAAGARARGRRWSTRPTCATSSATTTGGSARSWPRTGRCSRGPAPTSWPPSGRYNEDDPAAVADALAANAERLAATFEAVPADGWDRVGIRRDEERSVLLHRPPGRPRGQPPPARHRPGPAGRPGAVQAGLRPCSPW